MSKDTGGPAFPMPSAVFEHALQALVESNLPEGRRQQLAEKLGENACGMTLRDYLAAQAMNGMMANRWNKNYSDWAREAYKLADAMLAERSKS